MNQIIDSMKKEMLETLCNWIRIPSCKGEPKPGAPFGEEVRKALDLALSDAQKMGFKVRNFDGYAGDISMGPKGVNPLAILGHLDVVPTGEGWTVEPYDAIVRDGKIYGRGSSDDKGPIVAALYAMLAVKKAGLPLNREIRLILGCDEECDWDCIRHYQECTDLPREGFSPDASYPLINTEKGGVHIALSGKYVADGLRIKEMNVGTRPNVVPGTASVLVYGNAALAEKAEIITAENGWDIKAEVVEDGIVRLISTGITGHAAFPETAKNALGQLLLLLRELGAEGCIKTLAEKIGMEYKGESLEIACSDDISGYLTNNLGILRYNETDGLYAMLDIRFPILASCEAIVKSASAALAPDVEAKLESMHAPHHVSPNSKLVKKLLQAYETETGKEGTCFAIGGGTYAKVLEEGVAFGAIFPGEEELAHQADEYMPLESLYKNTRIIAKAIELLQ